MWLKSKKQKELHLWQLTLNIPAHMFWYAWLIVISRLKGRTVIKKKITHTLSPLLLHYCGRKFNFK